MNRVVSSIHRKPAPDEASGLPSDLPEAAREIVRRDTERREAFAAHRAATRRAGRRSSLVDGAAVMGVMALVVYPGVGILAFLAALAAGVVLGSIWDRTRAGPDRSVVFGLPFHLFFLAWLGIPGPMELICGFLGFVTLCCAVGVSKEGRRAAGFDR